MGILELITGSICIFILIFLCIELILLSNPDGDQTFSTRIMNNYMIVEIDNKFQAYQRAYYCFIPTNIKNY